MTPRDLLSGAISVALLFVGVWLFLVIGYGVTG